MYVLTKLTNLFFVASKQKLDWSSLVDDDDEQQQPQPTIVKKTIAKSEPVQHASETDSDAPKSNFGLAGVKIKQRESATQQQQQTATPSESIKKRPVSASAVQTKPVEVQQDLEHLKNQQAIMATQAEERRKKLQEEHDKLDREQKEKAEARLKALMEKMEQKKKVEQEAARTKQAEQQQLQQQEDATNVETKNDVEHEQHDHSTHQHHSRGRGNYNRGSARGRGRGNRGRGRATYRLVSDRTEDKTTEQADEQQTETQENAPKKTIASFDFEKMDMSNRRRKSIDDEQPSTPPPTPAGKPVDIAILDIDESGIVLNKMDEAPKISFGTLDSSVEEEKKATEISTQTQQHPPKHIMEKKPIPAMMPPPMPVPQMMYPPYADMYHPQWQYPVMFHNQMVYYHNPYDPYTYPATKIAHLPQSRPPAIDPKLHKPQENNLYIPTSVPPQQGGEIRSKPVPAPYHHNKPKKNQQQAAAPQENMDVEQQQTQQQHETEYVRSHGRGGYRGGKHHNQRGKKMMRIKYVPANQAEQGSNAPSTTE